MERYLGETVLNIHETEYAMYSPKDWALLWIHKYGGIDGAHHKDWVLDQVSRILNGTKIIMKHARWSTGEEEYRFTLDEPSYEYYMWVDKVCAGEDGPNTYSYNVGITP